MAPEQVRAEKLDHRVDIYAAGGMLFELLTGRAPYIRGTAAELLAAHLHAPVPDPSSVVPTLPSAICDVVCKAMAKNAADRHASMAELAADISIALPRRRRRHEELATRTRDGGRDRGRQRRVARRLGATRHAGIAACDRGEHVDR